MKKWYLIFLFVFLAQIKASAQVIETSQITDVKKEVEADTLLLFDMDATLTDSKYQLGTQAWRHYIKKMLAKVYDVKSPGNLHDKLAYLAASKVPVQAVEPEVVDMIHDFQEREIAVFCLTARGKDRWYSTPIKSIDRLSEKQLKSIGIDFSLSKLPSGLLSDPEFRGIFLTDSELKGAYLKRLLDQSDYRPKKVVFVDDSLEHIESVEAALAEMGIPSVSFWYRKVENTKRNFDPLIASIQLKYLLKDDLVLSDEEAALKLIRLLSKPALPRKI